ncbi:AAA family ATPase [Paenibacillus caseinilyticus]|nr:SMC family ATPase [Paenibacillus mucilaginosus]AGN70769.1 hypothetical protein B2K_40010 [Paenibacillus mucilaginosus K02]
MRPIHLQIAGLQSYREAQEIDFTELTGAGVFGIFGPTGSGKSTLLDAMTLALYGKVERANGGTQAIMNQAEQSLSVSFTFELTSAEGPKRYRVDRQFKRGGDVSVLGSLTRLIHFRDGEAVVLADKAGEVNSRIQEILGLAMADFTRAVVLPQGKFAEFLTLAGKDRRAMLQRLFHLEPYGDRLSAKTSGRLKETDVKIRALQAEQQGLGDASKEALEAAEARLLEAREAARTVRERLADCERRTAELRAVRELQRERAALAARQAALAADAPRIAALAARLARAAQAERLRPLVRRQRAAEAHLAQQREAAQAAAAALGAAQQALAAAQQRQAAAQGALAAQEAPLAARLEQLRQAAELAAELAQGRERLAALAAEGARCGEALAALGAERTREAELREKALQRQAQLKAELKQAEVPSAYRTLLQEAVAEKRELGRLAKQLEEQTAELAKRQSEHEALERRRAELKERRALEAQRLSPAAERLAALRGEAVRTEQWLAAAAARVPVETARLRREQQQAELGVLAAQLAAHLHEGEACPVCGAVEHPAPAGRGADGAGHAQAIEAWEQLEFPLREKMTAAARQLMALQAAAEGLAALAESAALPEAAGLREAAAGTAPGAADDVPADPEAVRNGLQDAAEALTQLQKQTQELHGQLQQWTRESRETERLGQELAARTASAQGLLDSAEARLRELTAARATTGAGWEQRFPGIPVDGVTELAAQLQEKDRLAEDLRTRLDKSVTFLEEKGRRLEELQRQVAEAEKTAVRLSAEQDALQRQTEQGAARLQEWVGGEDVSRLVREVQGELQRLRSAAQEAADALQTASAAHQDAARTEAAARQGEASAAAAVQELETEWLQLSQQEGFSSRDEVEAALIGAGEQEQWAAEVEAHGKQEHQLTARAAEIDAELAGREVSEEAWQALSAELAACKQEDEACLQQRARAERDAEELQGKHRRWTELEEQRAACQEELTLLGKLQGVLRGNAFVEYLAEEQLMHVSRAASDRLGQLTRQKYAIEVDSGGGFVIRDDANGGVRRPVTTLSGGETFLTSLSLALALSTQIQLKGEHPLEFFFLDEGFGTLDGDLLDAVISALEKLHMDKLTVGVISHVPELRARLPRRLIVHPAEPGGQGSRVQLETM